MKPWKRKSLVDYKGEIWAKMPSFEHSYMVSNFGRVKSIERDVAIGGGWSRYHKSIIIKQSEKFGYFAVSLPIKKKGRSRYNCFRVHILVAKAFISNPSNKRVVNHKNGKKHDNRASNLEWATDRENTLHAIKNKLIVIPCGEKARNVKLSKSNVLKIRKLRSLGKEYKKIGEVFGISGSYAHNICSRKTWKHI